MGGEIIIEYVSSDLEHFSEGPHIRRQSKISDPPPLRSRSEFRSHSKRAEQHRLRPCLLDGFQELVPVIGMIAVNDYGTRLLTKDRILDRLRPAEELRLESLELYQHTQQRRDDFLACENQHRAQRNQPSWSLSLVGNLWT